MTFKTRQSAALIVYALLLALGLGLGSAYYVLQGDPPFGASRIGSWITWPKLGSPGADPYMRAIAAKRGDVPLAIGEGLTLIAETDSAGRRLDGTCAYRVGSATPQARLWTLTLNPRADDGSAQAMAVSPLGRTGFTSSEIIRRDDSGFEIVLSKRLSPGNWLQITAPGPFSLVLRLYDMPGAAGSSLDESALPSIERIGCDS